MPPQAARLAVQVRRSSDDLLMVLSFSAERGLYAPSFLSGWIDQQLKDRLQRIEGTPDLFGDDDR